MTARRRITRAAAALVAGGACIAIAAALAVAGSPAPPPLLSVLHGPDGFIRLQLAGTVGSVVVVTERDGDRSPAIARLTLARGRQILERAAPWRCNRRDRVFAATASLPDGTTTTGETRVHTPSCATRVRLALPTRVTAGRTVTLRLRDRWLAGGLSARVCVTPPGGIPGCRTATLPRESRPLALPIRARRIGRWTVRVSTASGQRRARSLAVRPRSGRLRLLTIGDSEMQLLDEFIAGDLRSSGVHLRQRSDARISTGLSNSSFFNWPPHARNLARVFRPDVSVVFLGANDGYPLPTASGRRAACCGQPWVRAYSRRVGTMMASMLRRGSGRVYWVLLPVARDGQAARYFRAVNAGIRLAASSRRGEVRLIDTNATFAPDGVYRPSISYHGRSVTVRDPDGYHLSITGTRIAARILENAMRADGVVGGG